jgi:hypothetical protein
VTISEAQLETWAKQGPTAQFTATYDTLKAVLNDSSSPYYAKDYAIFLQGSYKNDTNVYGDSDVDVVIRLNETFYTDLSQLPEDDKVLWNSARSDASYSLNQFKADVLSWLTKKFGNDVQPGTKAIFLKGNGGRRDADVLVCANLRRYHRYKNWQDQKFTEGICFFLPDGTRIDNFPSLHSDNCTQKHQGTKNWFKPTVRICKNLRNALVQEGKIKDGLAPSYFLEGLLYNVPISQFGGTEQQNLKDTLEWLNKADRSKFLCANEQYYLFHASSPVTWRTENCEKFLGAAVERWNNGRVWI